MKKITSVITGILLVWVAVSMTSCVNDETTVDDVVNIGDLKPAEMIRYDNKDFIESYSLVKLELGDNSIIGRIDQIQCYNDQLYILDRRGEQLLVFEMDGRFSHKIGQMGRGPTEYLALCSFYINPKKKTVVIFDPLGVKAVRYDMSGNFIDSRKSATGVKLQSISNAACFGDGKIICYANPNGMTDEILFTLNEEDLSFADKIVNKPFDMDQCIYSVSKQQFSLVDGELHFVKWFDNIVYNYQKGEIKPLLQIVDKPLVPDATLKNIADDNSGDFTKVIFGILNAGKYSAGLKDFFETDRFMIVTLPWANLLVYDKQTHTSRYIPKTTDVPVGLNDIIYSSKNTVICCWEANSVKTFAKNIVAGRLDAADFDDKIVEVANSYDDTQDNPLLLVYKMKK